MAEQQRRGRDDGILGNAMVSGAIEGRACNGGSEAAGPRAEGGISDGQGWGVPGCTVSGLQCHSSPPVTWRR